MRPVRYLLLVVALLAAGCSGSDKTEEVREFLRVNYEFEESYDGLGTVTVEDGEVTVDTEAWHDPAYGAYLYCSWVENWVRRDLGDPDMDIVVVMDGAEVLRARGASEPCRDAEPQL